MTRPWEAIAAELLKCVMLCANCHREIHAGVRQLERPSCAIVLTAPIDETAAA
jgi:predicted HNH restriction endonuclease